jgi:hypothetical protein
LFRIRCGKPGSGGRAFGPPPRRSDKSSRGAATAVRSSPRSPRVWGGSPRWRWRRFWARSFSRPWWEWGAARWWRARTETRKEGTALGVSQIRHTAFLPPLFECTTAVTLTGNLYNYTDHTNALFRSNTRTSALCSARILGPQSPIQHTHGLKTDTLFYPSQATRASTTRT